MSGSNQYAAEPAWMVRRDAVYLITVFVSGIALIGAILAVGLSARAVNGSNRLVKVDAAPPAARLPAAAGKSLAVSAASGAPASPAPVSGTAASGVPAAGTSLTVTEKDFAISASASRVTAGQVNLTVTNSGPSPHELVLFKTSLAPEQLPVVNGAVDEGNSQLTKAFDSGNNIDPGTTRTFSVHLAPGSYVLVCNLPAHYLAGMHAALEVG
jgi:uncharacterized cupredoxin-like copper-binding protein